jgi:hypothetical protein
VKDKVRVAKSSVAESLYSNEVNAGFLKCITQDVGFSCSLHHQHSQSLHMGWAPFHVFFIVTACLSVRGRYLTFQNLALDRPNVRLLVNNRLTHDDALC